MSAATDAKYQEFVQWVLDSSAPHQQPVGKGTIDNGAYAVFAPVDFDGPPSPIVDPPALAIYLPNTIGFAIPPRVHVATGSDPGPAHGSFEDRIQHIVKVAMDGRFKVCVIALVTSQETIRYRLERQLPGLDLEESAVIALPAHRMSPTARNWVTRNTPVYG